MILLKQFNNFQKASPVSKKLSLGAEKSVKMLDRMAKKWTF